MPDSFPAPRRRSLMEPLLLLAFLVAWIVIQIFVLPRFGVRT
jgi:hypothetical protein